MEKIVVEINELLNWIVGLVSLVKVYIYMDQVVIMEVCFIYEGIKSMLMMFKYKFKCKQIKLDKEIDFDVLFVEILFGEMNQVWINIIDNVIDVMLVGGILLICIYWKYYNMLVDFIDNGLGILEEVIGQIFDFFFIIKGVGEGIGLGFEVLWCIVEKYKGIIEVELRLGQIIFMVCLFIC